MWIRLRQIAFVAHELEPVVDDLRAVLGLDVAYRDPGVATFGLHNAVMPAGQQFIEVVSPTQDGTAGGRYLERRKGDGGYMVILQCEDHGPVKARIDELGVRKVIEQDTKHYKLLQLHPRDTGGSFLEIDVQVGGESMDGPWEPAGPQWQQARTDAVSGIIAAEIQADDPAALAARWSSILDRDLRAGVDGHPTIDLDNASLRFVAITDGRGEGLGGIDVAVTAANASRVLAAAEQRDRRIADDQVDVGGMRIAIIGT